MGSFGKYGAEQSIQAGNLFFNWITKRENKKGEKKKRKPSFPEFHWRGTGPLQPDLALPFACV